MGKTVQDSSEQKRIKKFQALGGKFFSFCFIRQLSQLVFNLTILADVDLCPFKDTKLRCAVKRRTPSFNWMGFEVD